MHLCELEEVKVNLDDDDLVHQVGFVVGHNQKRLSASNCYLGLMVQLNASYNNVQHHLT